MTPDLTDLLLKSQTSASVFTLVDMRTPAREQQAYVLAFPISPRRKGSRAPPTTSVKLTIPETVYSPTLAGGLFMKREIKFSGHHGDRTWTSWMAGKCLCTKPRVLHRHRKS